MIAKLKGIIENIGEDCCIIDVNGVGYLVNMSARSLSRLKTGEHASLLIETIIKEDSITLFGFENPWEKEWFNTLTKVQGVGGKVCLAILSALSPSQLSQAISAQDKSSFVRANGVGPKLAARIVTELRDKIVTIPVEYLTSSPSVISSDEQKVSPVVETKTPNNQQSDDSLYQKIEDLTSALTNLGYQKIEAYRVATDICNQNQNENISNLIRLALKEFNK